MDSRPATMMRIKARLSVSKRAELNPSISQGHETATSPGDLRDSSEGTISSMESKKPRHIRSSSFFDRLLRGVHPGPATPFVKTSLNEPSSPNHTTNSFDLDPPGFRLVASSESVTDLSGDDMLVDRKLVGVSHDQMAQVSSNHGIQTSPHHTRDFKRMAFNTLRLSLVLLEKLADSFPIPGLKGGLGGVNTIIDRFDKANQNTKDMDFLLESFTSLSDILFKFQNTKSVLGSSMTAELRAQISALSEEINETKDGIVVEKLKDELKILQSSENYGSEDMRSLQIEDALEMLSNAKIKLENTQKHRKARKVVDSVDDAQFIVDQYRRLEGSINNILVGSALRTEGELAEQQAFELLDRLPRAKNARYDYVERPRCLPGTREAVLKELGLWACGDSERQIYWLTGGAGTGKTTVALTLAHAIEAGRTGPRGTNVPDGSILSTSFFCSRGDSDRSNIHYIFPTLSYILAQRSAAFRNELVKIIKDSPDIAHAPPDQQCSQLLIRPLKAARLKNPIMIILDALDECVDPRCPEIILTSLASRIREVDSLKVFVSSRSTSSTNDAFADDELRKLRTVFILHDVEKDIVRSDIKNYITSRLRSKAQLRKVDIKNWPPEDHVDLLVDKANGLFIYASTVCEFIERPGNLPFMLQPIAEAPSKGYTGIDALYKQILNNATENMEENSIEEVRTIINTIIHLQNPLSAEDLGGFLGFPALQVQGRLGDLQPVLAVPENLEEHVHTFHASFHDYLTDERRCLPRMYMPSSSQHKNIAMQALKTMQAFLKRDICQIGAKFKTEFSTLELQDLNKRYIPGFLGYACKHWADHIFFVCITDQDTDMLQALDDFASTTSLFWIETLSLMGILDVMLGTVERLCSWYDDLEIPVVSTFRKLLGEIMLSFPQYISAINDCPSQVYTSVLPFLSPNLQLRDLYLAPSHPTVSVSSGTLLGINCVCYSPDGSKVVCGLMDGSINIWDPILAIVVETQKVHSQTVLALAYSPDCKMLASVSSEGSLKIWDTPSGLLKGTIDLPAERTNSRRTEYRASLTFSTDSHLLAFISPNSIHIWNLTKWKERFTGQNGSIVHGGNWVALAPNKTCFAVADNHGIYVVDFSGLRYIVRDQLKHRHLTFSKDGTLLRSTQGTYNIAAGEPVEAVIHHKKFSEGLCLYGGWLIGLDGEKRCWIPETYRKGDSYAVCRNKIVFYGNDGLTFVEVHS